MRGGAPLACAAVVRLFTVAGPRSSDHGRCDRAADGHGLATDFFQRQHQARQHTNWLRLLFALAVLATVAVVSLVVLLGLTGSLTRPSVGFWTWIASNPGLYFKTAALMLVIVLAVAGGKAWKLRRGGPAVAMALGGIPIDELPADPRLRLLQNVVDEMALAAQFPSPQIFVLPDERNINAFAAGRDPETAVIGMTAGVLHTFNRAELQAIIGHEFSHILNGDMALNTRLIAWQRGLYAFTDIAKKMAEGDSKKGIPDFRVLVIAPLVIGLYVTGCVGRFVGRLLQASISRRREQLADASAVQFTRDAESLKSALIKIAARPGGGALKISGAADMAHMFFATSDDGWFSRTQWSWLATHPSLHDRVQALDKHVSKAQFARLTREEREKWQDRAERNADLPPFAPKAAATRTATPTTAASWQPRTVGQAPAAHPSPAADLTDLLYNRLTRDQQNSVAAFLATVDGAADQAAATVVTALLSSHAARRDALRAQLRPVLGESMLQHEQAIRARFEALEPIARLPTVAALLPLIERSDARLRAPLLTTVRAFASQTAIADSHALAVTRLVLHRLGPRPAPTATPLQLGACTAEIGLLLSLIARHGSNAGFAYKAGIQGLLKPQSRPDYSDTISDAASIDAALACVAQLHPSAKRAFCDALVRAVSEDDRLTAPKADLLRMICACMDWALPSLPLNTVYRD